MQVSRSGRLPSTVQHHRANLIEQLEPRQLLSAGDLDTSFQTTGQYINSTQNGGVHDIAGMADGSFYAATGTRTMAVQKYSSTGQLQSTFTASKVTIGGYVTWGAATVAVQDDGKILLAGASFADLTNDGSASIARLTAAGQADTSWNGTGVVQLTLPGVKQLGISTLAIQSDGKIVAAGGTETSFFVARFTSSGALDSTFDADGIKTFSFPHGSTGFQGEINYEYANDLVIGDDGKILLAGSLNTRTTDPFLEWDGMAVARLNSDGSLDSSFDGDGKLVIGGGTYQSYTYSDDALNVALQADGKILIGGRVNGVAAILRRTASGAPDNSFDQDGMVTFPEAGVEQIGLLSSGQIMVLSDTGNTTILRRLNTSGAIDSAFGTAGTVSTDWNPANNISGVTGSALLVQADGKVLVGVERNTSNPTGMSTGVARYLTDVPGASISGVVTIDVNGNGVVDPSEGAYNAQVFLDTNHNNVLDAGERSTTANVSGQYQFTNVLPGTYDVRSTSPGGWFPFNPSSSERTVVVSAGSPGVTGVDFIHQQFGTISGYIFDDQNNNGVQDNGEGAFTAYATGVYLDLNNNGDIDTGEPSSYTGGTGKFNFTYVPPGTYTIRLSLADSTAMQTYPANKGAISVTVAAGQIATPAPFGVTTAYTVKGFAFDDVNGDGIYDATTETLQNGRSIYVDSNDNGSLDTGEPSAVTSSGKFSFKLPAGTYRLRQVLPAGYRETARSLLIPMSGEQFTSSGLIRVPTDVTNVTGIDQQLNFGSKPKSVTRVYGFVVHDTNGNGVIESGESGAIAGDVVYLDANNNGAFDNGELSFTTAANGWSFNLTAGSYVFRQLLPSGWIQTLPAGNAPLTATVTEGGASQINAGFFGKYQPPVVGGSISGTVYNDANNNAKRDSGEVGVAGVTIYNDANNNSKLDSGEKTTITDANGLYTLAGLNGGSYKIRQILQSGWAQTTPANNYGWTITLATNQKLTGKDFGTRQTNVTPPPPTGGSIGGTVFNDLDGDRVQDSNEVGVANVTIYNDANNNSRLDTGEKTTVTDSSGAYVLSNLAGGSYKIRQILQSGWAQTTPANNYGWTISLGTNQVLAGKDFGTRETNVVPPPPTTGASISGTVWNDVDGDRVKDSGELGVAGVTLYNDANNNSKLDAAEKTTVSDADGLYTFTGLASGSYKIRQILQSGWIQTTPTNNYGWTISLASNQALAGKDFGTRQSGVTPPASAGAIAGITFNDNNKNGAFDGGDQKTSGKTVFLDTNNNGKLDSGEKSVVSDANGNWSFSGLSAGTYHVRRVFPSGYTYSTTLIDLTLGAGDNDIGLLIGSKSV